MHSPHHRRAVNVRKLLAAASCTALATLASSHADAGLNMDVRIVGASPGVFILNPKQAIPSGPGDTVTLAVFAQVSGTDGNNTNEYLQSGLGSIFSYYDTPPAVDSRILGNLSGSVISPRWTGTSASNGSVQDLDSDGDLDIGSNGTASAGKIVFRFPIGGGDSLASDPKVDSNTSEAQVYQATFQVTSTGTSTFINWVTRKNANGSPISSSALWWEDGDTINSKNAGSGSYTAGAPVLVGIPEPTALALCAFPALGLLTRRPRRKCPTTPARSNPG